MTDHVAIPKEAWEGVGDPEAGLHTKCWTCGGSHVRDLSMAEMLHVPPARIVNAHTFMIPNMAWGYIQCDDCEDRQEKEAHDRLASRPWWKRLLGMKP